MSTAAAGAHLLDCFLVGEVQADVLGALHIIIQRVPADSIHRRELLSTDRSPHHQACHRATSSADAKQLSA